MKADPRDQRELLRVQELDTAIAQANRLIANPPQAKALAELAPAAAEIRSRRLAVSGERDDAQAELARLESDVKVVESRMQRDSERVQHTSSVKDVAALEAELGALRKRRSDLEDIELAIMERIEGLESTMATIDAEGADTEARVAQLDAERDAAERYGRIKDDIDRKIETENAAHLEEYKKQRESNRGKQPRERIGKRFVILKCA